MLVFLSACGTGSKDSAVDSFLNRIKTVSQENPELSGYSISGLTEEGSGTYSANAIIDGETIGAISISVYNKQITELSFSFFGDGEKYAGSHRFCYGNRFHVGLFNR